MDDAKTPNRWVQSLDKAGLLDDIEDGWTLPNEPVEKGSSIRVDAVDGGGAHPPLSDDEPEPHSDSQQMLLQQGAVDIAIVDEAPRTPVERHVSSKPGLPAPPPVPAHQIPLSSARATQSGMPRPSQAPPGVRKRKPAAPRREDPPAEDREPPRWELVRKSKSRISVTPDERRRSSPDALQPIVDEPPEVRRPRRRTSKLPRVSLSPDDRRTQMRERLELGDYSGALAVAEEIAKSGGEDSEVKRVAKECRRVLMGMYESRIGSFDRVPKVAVSPHELVWRNLDAATGFVLSRIDGMSSFEDVVDISGLSRFDTCRILNQLLQDGIIR
ncbi:MAG: hypothetical protein M0R80_19750 [Proteobacteria bacterium]|jgi:hypothetical protein|nr:hypothetical protein [Pseudomonadota bacterium]